MTAKDLKNALLQEAVQGKLVPQIASEGNARDLLEEIRKERLSHGFANSYGICDGKDKKTKKSDLRSKSQISVTKKELPEITEDEIPFEIPESWCWCRLGDIINIKSGDGLTSSQMKKGNIPVFGGNGITGYHNISNIHKESIVIGRVGFYCGSVHITPNEAWVTDNAFITTYPEKQIDKRFLVYVLRHLNLGQDNNATAQPVVSGKKIYPIPFPLPPLAEQKRIVSAIEKFMPLIEEYGKKETELKALNEQIGTLTKKAILQEAFQGRLLANPPLKTSFDLPGNGPSCPQADTAKTRGINLQTGKALLEEIRKEKARLIKEGKLKKEKPLPEITEDEIPFDIPESWCWCRLGEIVPFGVCQNAEPQEIDDEDWILDLEDIEKDSGKILSFKTKKEVDSKSTKHIFKKGFVLYSKLRPYLNKCVIAPKDGFCTSEILPLDFGDMIYNKYAQLYLMSPFFVDYTNSLSFGVKMPRLGTEDGRKALFPLPPLAEQKRIVEAIENLLPLCETLKI